MKRLSLVLAALATLGLGAEAQAQEAVSQDVRQELRALLAESGPVDADRAAVASFLTRDDVRRTAAARGIDLERLESGVQALSAGELAPLAERARDAQEQLAGGLTITVTSTAIIIALLVVILIAVV